jgi:hypothetical protein
MLEIEGSESGVAKFAALIFGWHPGTVDVGVPGIRQE